MSDLILFNARAITMDHARPAAELIAVTDGKISVVAGNEALNALKNKDTRTVDCAGRTLLPGFVDAHCHVHAYAESLVSLNLSPGRDVKSISDLQNKIRESCKDLPRGAWVRGKRYSEFYLDEKRHPNRWDLDAAAPLHPVKLTHRSGHAHVLNSLALQIAGIDEETGDPPEGIIDRDLATGSPTGILFGMGEYLSRKIPRIGDSEMNRGIELANSLLVSHGITSVQDASSVNGPENWQQFENWKSSGLLQPRVTMMLGFSSFLHWNPAFSSSAVHKSDLNLTAVKIIADQVTGALHPSQDELNEAVSMIHAAGRQAAIHAIEEPVIEAAANAIESALKANPRQDHRHRIEHCSVCPPSLLQRLAALGIVIVTQPSFIHYSGDRYLQTVPGEQLKHLYPVRSMMEMGLQVGGGSDFPITDPNPMLSIGAAVTRRTESGATLPEQRISLEQALRMHTIGAAAAVFEDRVKGSLTPGKLADMVVLDENPFEVAPEYIKDIRIEMTIIGGTVIKNHATDFTDGL